MAVTVRKTTVYGNPGRKAAAYKKVRRAGSGHSSRSSNPGHIIGYTLGNPGRKATMKHAKKSTAARGYKKRSNPGVKITKYRKARRHNLGGRSSGGIMATLTNSLFVVVGAISSKIGAQAVLGTNNTGVIGYAGNAAIGALLYFLASKFMKNKAIADGLFSGTLVQIILRVINDQTPFGSYVNQLGMGDYQMQSFVTPQVLVDPLNNATIQIPTGWAPTTVQQIAAPAGMSGLYDNFGSAATLYGR